MAQLGARLDGIEEVVGSNPIGSTKDTNDVLPVVYSPKRNHESLLHWSDSGRSETPGLPQRQLLESIEESRPLATHLLGGLSDARGSHAA